MTTKPRSKPTKLTPQNRRRLLKCLALGTPIGHAASACGINYHWLCAYRSRNPHFESAIQRAIAKAIESRLAIIKRAADQGEIRAAIWYLEKCHSRFFGNRLELTGTDGAPLAVAVGVYLPAKNGSQLDDLPPTRLITDTPRTDEIEN